MRVFKRIKIKKFISAICIAVILVCVVCFFSTKFFEKNAYDAMIKLSANKIGSDNIINVVIDDDSIKEIGAWPWKRTLYTDMFAYLQNAGVKMILFDAVIPSSEDNQDDEEFLRRIFYINSITGGVEFTKNENVINKEDELAYFEEKFSVKVTDNRSEDMMEKSEYKAYQEMLPGYINSINSIASVNTALDNDGAVRAFEPFVKMNDKYYPALPMYAYMKINNIKEVVLYDNGYEAISNDGNIYRFPLNWEGDKSVQYIKWLAPYDKNSWIPHEQIKASDILKSASLLAEGNPPIIAPERLKDKIIVVGATANALYDLKITPMTINMPGSTIQATILDNLLSNDSMQIAPVWVNVLICFLFIGMIFALVYYTAPLVSVISGLILGFLYFYLALFAYSKGYALNMVAPYIFFVLTAIFAFSYKFSVEDYKKEKLKKAMKQYIGTTVVDNIIKDDKEVALGGKKTEVTILMADIRGFTRFSENLDPDAVTKLLNEYFELMIPIIENYGGVVNKFIGDAILAVFNEPVKDKRHPYNAILCANKMLKALKDLRKKWKAENKPDIGISIGINTGMAFIGNIGTPNHLEYTVIGDTVNVASRIEAQNRQFNTQLLISESTYEYAKDMLDVIKISSVEIRGREKHMNIYEIIKILDNNEII